jgi:hypothetical protein
LLFEDCWYRHSCQGLVMMDLLDNFLNPLFWPWQTISRNRNDRDLQGVRRE